jgi:hypothetical protein
MLEDPTPTLARSKEPVRQFSLFLENRVGALLGVVRLLQANQIELLGHSLQEVAELTLLRIIVSYPDSASTLFMERGIAHTSTEVVVVEIKEGNEGLTRCLLALQEAEVNVRTSYGLSVRPGLYPLIAMHVDEPDTAAEALNRSGFNVVQPDELIR